jgi:hypothetical protein
MGRGLNTLQSPNSMTITKSITLTLFFLSGILTTASAQQYSRKGTVHLKNQWVLNGSISPLPDGGIRVETRDGNIFSFPMADIDSITYGNHGSRNSFRAGFGHFTEIGALAATKNRPDNVTTAAFSFQVVNGYHFAQMLFVGIGTGVDLYATQTTVPLFGSLRGDLTRKGDFIPFYFVDGGYGFDITSSTTSISYRGGPLFAAGFGFKARVSDRSSFIVSFGYRLQKGSTTENGSQRDYSNNRIALRAGFAL